uniref:Uncharacterized protein n=1 Tax=Brassica oleracea TaxID=3712 RepID=A0A3P6CBJ5_BRAOL|nr:unnamed protein product [Brassica oleracea]
MEFMRSCRSHKEYSDTSHRWNRVRCSTGGGDNSTGQSRGSESCWRWIFLGLVHIITIQ